jgi:hypothetical protein
LPDRPDGGWESGQYVRRSIILPLSLADRLAAEAERRGLPVSDLLIEYAEQGLRAGRNDHGTLDR